MSRLRRFVELSGAERVLLIRAGVYLLTVRLALWLLPFRTVHRAVMRMQARVPPAQPIAPDRIAWAVTTTSRFVPPATCLTQALAVQALLGREGRVSRLRLGVGRGDRGDFESHAWLECDGVPIIGAHGMERFTPFPSMPHERV